MKTFEGHYARKEYAEALKVLNDQKDNLSQDLWHYNLGTTYAQLKEFPLARFHLLTAQKQGFSQAGLYQNLEIVEANLETTRLERSLSAGDNLFKAGIIISDGILVTLSLLAIAVGVWFIKKKPSLRLIVLIISVVLLLVGFNHWLISLPRSIVMENQALYEGPSAIFQGKDEVPAGVLVITEDEGQWKRIIFPSRFEGWVKSTGLKELQR
ncbi:MAG TPA: hypothetical protein VNJ01_14675 [Bacteriovoracaceae bacterium]|nr:hypothetical protein [Bacteriovoracaceae bacterium]